MTYFTGQYYDINKGTLSNESNNFADEEYIMFAHAHFKKH